MGEANQCNLTEDEADLYDRQIRLWGLDSQKRLRAATILLIGLKGLGAEFCKNVVLSGIKSLTLLDDSNSSTSDTYNQFLIPRDQIGKNRAVSSVNRAKALNPMVDIIVDTESIDKKSDEFFTQFNVVVATDCNLEQLLRINNICHNANVKFFCADVYGFYGYIFADLQSHEYGDEKFVRKTTVNISESEQKKDDDVEIIAVKKTLTYPSLQESLAASKKLTEKSPKLLADMVSFFLLKVLLKFRTEVGRNPEATTRAVDYEKLKKFREYECQELGICADLIPDEYLAKVFSQVSPVCAIVGGELAQEVIKSVSQNGETYNNFFFFNPIKNHGIVINVSQ